MDEASLLPSNIGFLSYSATLEQEAPGASQSILLLSFPVS